MTIRPIAACVITLLGPAAAAAQNPTAPPRVEIFGAFARPLPAAGGTLDARYEPPLRSGGTRLSSESSQTLTVDASAGRGAHVGANIFVSRAFGVQTAFTRTSADVTGVNDSYDVALRYIALMPPGYTPVELSYARSNPWGDTAGTLTVQSVSLGGVVRWRGAGGAIGGTLAGGVSRDRYTGDIESLAYTQFVMGGHSTLFPVVHRVAVAPAEGESFWHPYAAADVHVRVAPRIAVFGGVRVPFGSRMSMPTTAVRLVDPDENPFAPALTDVRENLDGRPLDLPGTRWQVLFGAKIFVR